MEKGLDKKKFLDKQSAFRLRFKKELYDKVKKTTPAVMRKRRLAFMDFMNN